MLRRLHEWIRFRRDRGESVQRTILVHAPRRALRAITDVAYSRFHRHPSDAWCAQLLQRLASCRSRPYVLIAVPGTLHTVVPCIALAQRQADIVVLGNGLHAWEAEELRAAAPRFLELPALRGTMVPHGVVLRLLVQVAKGDIALHDPDLFVFRPGLYAELEPREGELAVGIYGIVNEKTCLRFPTTHLLAFDAASVRRICQTHGITPETYSRTPERLREPLAAIGIGDHNRPKDYLRFYDVFTLVWAIALAEKHRFRVVSFPQSEDAWHVGGISYDRSNRRLRYVHARFLELPSARRIRARYWPRLVGTEITTRDLERDMIQQGAESMVRAIDSRLEKVAEVVSSP